MEEEKKVANKKEKTEVKKEEVKKEASKKDEKKKFENAKTDKKKTNNTSMIIVAVVIIAALVVIAILYSVLTANTPKNVVETMLRDLKTGNYDQWISQGLLEEEEIEPEAQKLLFNELSWKFLNVKEEGDKATVEVEITNKDFKTILGNYMQKAVKAAFSGQNVSDEEMTNYLIEELNNTEISKATTNQSIVLNKQDGKWKISEENDLVEILLPGFKETINSLNF